MRSPLPSLFRILGLALLLATLTLTAGAPDAAAAQECQFQLEDGSIRKCTFTEQYGQCLFGAWQSYQDCLVMGETWAHKLMCDVAVEVDMLACTLGMLGDAVRLLSPF